MAGRSGRREDGRSFSGNHQRSWLWGYHAVTETLRAGRWPIVEIFATQAAFELSAELQQARSQRAIPIEIVSAVRLEQLVRSTEHQGLIARLGTFPYQPLHELMSKVRTSIEDYQLNEGVGQSTSDSLPPLIVVCDQIQDAFNFGAILRCCEGAAVLGVVVGDRSQAEVTPHVVRSSSGAVNYVPIVRTDDLPRAIRTVKNLGSQIVAADSNTTSGIWNTQFGQLTTLIVGSEAHGIHPDLLSLCDHRVCIPMFGRVTSLNAAVATGILLYEIRRQQLRLVQD